MRPRAANPLECVPILAFLLAATCGCEGPGPADSPEAPPGVGSASHASAGDTSEPFVDRTAETGIEFVHFNGMSGETAQAMFIAVRDGRQDLIESLQADLEGYRRERLPARPWRRDHPLSSPPRLNLDQRQ